MKDIAARNWDKIIPRLTSSARRRMIFLGKSQWCRRTPRFLCSSPGTTESGLRRWDVYQKEWQALIDRTLKGTPFAGSLVRDMPNSAIIQVCRISQSNINEQRKAA